MYLPHTLIHLVWRGRIIAAPINCTWLLWGTCEILLIGSSVPATGGGATPECLVMSGIRLL
jgi:hypothetical protein